MARRRLPRNTSDALDPTILLRGEIAYDETGDRLRVGDGRSPGGASLPRLGEAGFPSLAAARVARIPESQDVVRVDGFAAPGDGGGALYKRVATEPAHPGKFQSADGRWWELAEGRVAASMLGANGNGMADNTAAFARLKTLAEAGVSIHLPLGVYRTSEPLTFKRPVHLTADPGTRIVLSAPAAHVLEIDFSGASGGHFDHTSYLSSLVLDGGGYATDGLSLKAVISATFDHIRATNVRGAGLHLQWAQLCVFNHYVCSKNVEEFDTVPVNGILADKASSSANTFVNPTVEGVSGSGIKGVALVNSLLLNGTSEGNGTIGIELGSDGGDWSAIGNTVIGMDLEVNPQADILLNATADANDFYSLKAGYLSGPVTIKNGSGRNTFTGGVTGGFRMEAGSSNNKVRDVSLLGAAATISDQGVFNTVSGVANLSTATKLPDTRTSTSYRKETIVPNGGAYVMDARFADFEEVYASGPSLTISAPLHPTDGQVVDLSISNPTGEPIVVTWDPVFRIAAWVNPTSGLRCSVRLRYNANFGRWYTVGDPSQTGVPL